MVVDDKVWSEKYRPDNLDSVIGNSEQVNRMKKWTDDDSVPHLLLFGPAGTGKSTSIVAFAKEKYGDSWRSNLIEFNASDDRGIDVIRDQIKSTARTSATGDFDRKIIMLDESDSLTKAAQSALRRTMEKFSDKTIFALTCNYPNKIIDPIQSRCTALPFERLEDEEVKELLTRILNEEGVEYEESAVEKIIEYVSGDARRAVQTLQTSVQDGELTEDVLDVVGGQVDRDVLHTLVTKSVQGQMEDVHDSVVTDVLPNTVDYSELCGEMIQVLRSSEDVPEDVRWYMISRVGEVEKAINEGNNPNVQLMSYFAEIPVIVNSSIKNYE